MASKKPAKRTDSLTTRQRADGWLNVLTGIGTSTRDKRRANTLCLDENATKREYQEELWRADDMVARIIETVPDEMMRNGFELKIEDDAADTGETDPNEVDADGEATLEGEKPALGGEDAKVQKPAAKKPGARQDAFPPPGAGALGAEPPPEKPPGVIEPRGEDARKQADAVTARFEELGGHEAYLEALGAERAFGGAAILLGVDDGQNPVKPLNLDKIKSFNWLNVLTPREMHATRYYADPQKPNFGKPEIFRIMTTFSAGTALSKMAPAPTESSTTVVEVHESRLILFPGTVVSKRHRQQMHGWGDSVLVRCLSVVADFQMAFASSAHLLADFAQAVFKIKGLSEMVAQGSDEAVITRARLIDMSRSAARAVLIDAEEEFERKQTPVAGLAELLDKFATRLAAAADMPVTLLMGESPGGLNATGESDIRFFYDRIKARQNKFLKPRLERVLKLIMLAKDGPTNGVEPEDWCIEFAPLWQMSEKEQAEVRKLQADVDKIEIDAGVVTSEEVAASRHGGATWSSKTVIDLEGRKKLAVEFEEKTAEHAEKKAANAEQAAVDGEFAKGLAAKETDAKLAAAKRKPPAAR